MKATEMAKGLMLGGDLQSGLLESPTQHRSIPEAPLFWYTTLKSAGEKSPSSQGWKPAW